MGKYLDFYKECIMSGRIPSMQRPQADGGLCGVFGTRIMYVFTPTNDDCDEYDVCTWSYFASDPGWPRILGFGPTRQNIVLLLAAMNGEL